MRLIGLSVTLEAHVVFRILDGIGQQVAHHFGHRFLIYHGREVLVGIHHLEMLASLLEGGGETNAHRMYQLVDVMWGEMHHQTALLHLAEIEQLVHQFKQPVGVAVDDLHVVGRRSPSHDFLQGTNDERHRRANLVGNHREEIQTRLAHFFLLLFMQALHLYLVATLCPLQAEMYIIPDGGTQQ